jgi:polyhydroxybutyrate depolymerase
MGRSRRYLLHIPPAATSQPLPLVIMLHGTGGTAAWTRDETGWGHHADAHGFLAAFPEGLPTDPDRPPQFLRNPPHWRDGDVEFLTAVLDDIPRHAPVDPRRVYLTGFSSGAVMAFRFAAERSERLAAIAPVAGPCRVPDPHPARAVPTLFIVGTADPLMPLAGGPITTPWGDVEFRAPVAETLADWARALGCPAEPNTGSVEGSVECWRFGPGRDGAELVAYIVPELGHHWPGGLGRLNPRVAGRPSHLLDATAVIWQFFQRWTLPAA